MSFSFLEETALQYWAQLDCPTSLKLTILARAGAWAEVLTAKVAPEDFIDPEAFARANASVTFLKKNPFIPGFTDEDRGSACRTSWREGEASCYKANERLSPYIMHPLEDSMPAEFLRRARKILLGWLGPCPTDVDDGSLSYDVRPPLQGASLRRDERRRRTLADYARHGPGTTFSSSVANPTAADKYDDVLSLTRGSRFYLWNLTDSIWMRSLMARAARMSVDPLDCLNWSRGNRFTTVPKTAKTDRGIAIECTLNIYFQLAIGRAIRTGLRRNTGWDLDNAAAVHREVARKASVLGHYATIDLSNASDSLCTNLVRILLRGTPWLERMEDLRSTHTFMDGKWHRLEKFSSMGNGYTFELETCVFASLIAALLELDGRSALLGHDFFVFGDDIIVPTDTAESVVKALAWAGFRTNPEKTFLQGSFRESCGGDFFLGYPVRGFYLKQDLCYGTQAIYSLHNGAKTCLEICGIYSPWFLDWVRKRLLPQPLRHVGGQDRFGDSVLHGLPEAWRWRSGIRWVKVVTWHKPVLLKWKYWNELVRLACRLTGAGSPFGITSRGHCPAVGFDWVSGS
jgi:hypothetical protein